MGGRKLLEIADFKCFPACRKTLEGLSQLYVLFCAIFADVRQPVDHLQPITDIDIRHGRRALETDELRHLLETTLTQPKRFGMTGHERAMLYRFAAETGLRRNEIKSLKKSSFDFNNCTVAVKIACTKNKKTAVLPLRKATSAELQDFLAGKMPHVKAFKVPEKTADMIKEDLAAAEIAYVDDAGLFSDFHALRHVTGSLLAKAGVHPKVSQSLMRHSDINLTMSRYTHIFRGQESEAVEKLPDLSLPSRKNKGLLQLEQMAKLTCRKTCRF